jgi:hypothetical protein
MIKYNLDIQTNKSYTSTNVLKYKISFGIPGNEKMWKIFSNKIFIHLHEGKIPTAHCKHMFLRVGLQLSNL